MRLTAQNRTEPIGKPHHKEPWLIHPPVRTVKNNLNIRINLFVLYHYAICSYVHIYKRKNRRASRALFFLIGLRQAKVVRADACLTYNYMIKNRGCTVFDDSYLMNSLNSLYPLGVVRWLHEPQSTLRGGFHTVWGGIDPWDHRLASRFVGIVEIWKDF